jgi:hypothetical protein
MAQRLFHVQMIPVAGQASHSSRLPTEQTDEPIQGHWEFRNSQGTPKTLINLKYNQSCFG